MTFTQAASPRSPWNRVWLGVVGVILLILLVSSPIFVRTFLFQPFSAPSGSMSPTLQQGDSFFVSKCAYGYSHFSLPFSPPLFSGRIFGSEPARGDVVVFRLPKNTSTDYVKRVVGLLGDRIQMKQGLLTINGTPVQRERLVDFIGGDLCGSDPAARVKHWRETLPNGVSHEGVRARSDGSTFTQATGRALMRCSTSWS